MKKQFFMISVLVLLAFAASTIGASHDYNVKEERIELVEGLSVSYRLAITEELADFLVENGVSADLLGMHDRDSMKAKELTRAIEELKKTEPDDEDDVTLNEQFNTILAHALGSAYNAGYDPVFIDIGSVRYIRSTPIDDEE